MSQSNIKQVLAIDENDLVIGTYAVDVSKPELPGVLHKKLIDMPDTPVPTGAFDSYIDEDGMELLIERLEWPGVGWSYNNNVWIKN